MLMDASASVAASNRLRVSGVSVARQETTIEIEGRQLKLSNLDKVLYPKAGFSKGQVIDYYIRIAPVLLPLPIT